MVAVTGGYASIMITVATAVEPVSLLLCTGTACWVCLAMPELLGKDFIVLHKAALACLAREVGAAQDSA